MKKLTSMYKRYMFHPILYKTVTRTSIVAVLMLLWLSLIHISEPTRH